MNALEAFMLIVYILTSMLIISVGIIAMIMENYDWATAFGIVLSAYSMLFVHEYKRGTWKQGGKK